MPRVIADTAPGQRASWLLAPREPLWSGAEGSVAVSALLSVAGVPPPEPGTRAAADDK